MREPENQAVSIFSYDECVRVGGAILESYPPQCRTKDGKIFTQNIGNELEKADLIRVSTPRPNKKVVSPLVVEGEARGVWFFEAEFPVRIFDGNGTELGLGIARAEGEWMTEEFVAFKATVEFQKPISETGTLVLHKSNPSDLREHDDSLVVPIVFNFR